LRLIERESQSVREACRSVGIGKTTFYRHRKEIEKDARSQAIRDASGHDVQAEGEAILDTLNERKTDLGILNHLLGRLVKGVQDKVWTADEVEERLLQLVDAKGRLLSGVERARQMVQSLTLVDARSITFDSVPEDVRQALHREVCEEIWDSLCPVCKEALGT
jgi:transposase